MLRMALAAVTAVGLCALGARADDTKNPDNTKKSDQATNTKKNEATVTKVDAKNGTVTVKMKDKNGKDKERTFHLTGDVAYFDSTGRVAAADIFRSGDYVLVVEEQGKLKEIHKKDHNSANNKNVPKDSSSGKNPGGR